MRQKIIYNKLLRYTIFLLSNNFTNTNPREIQNIFIENFLEILEYAMQLNIDKRDLISLSSGDFNKNMESIFNIVIEREGSYALLNRFLLEFINLYLKEVKDEFKAQILQSTRIYDFDEDTIVEINTSFLNLINRRS